MNRTSGDKMASADGYGSFVGHLKLKSCVKFSARYGYGLMDAGALVVEAVDWAKSGRRLPSQKEFTKSVVLDSSLRGMKTRSTTKTYRRAGVEQSISGQEKTYSFEIDTANTNGGTIDRLEHVTCVVSAKVNGRRGNVRFFIQSPSGTHQMPLEVA